MTFQQNVLAVVWDFDKTLISHYMQEPLFAAYELDAPRFWDEVNALSGLYREQGVTVNPDTVYLNHLLSYVRKGLLPGLNNEKLRSFGKELHFFAGLPELFETFRRWTEQEPYKTFEIKIENYVVSTGLSEIIRGSAIYPYLEHLWGCEFIETSFVPTLQGLQLESGSGEATISDIGYTIDNTTKTRALFEINKGVHKHPDMVSVNQKIPEEDRRVPFANMIYVADGPSDVPAFSVVKKSGGKTLAVYEAKKPASFAQAKKLQEDGRVDHFAAADYREGTGASMWIFSCLEEMADRVIGERKRKLAEGRGSVPKHLT